MEHESKLDRSKAWRFLALAGVASFLIYSVGNRFDPVSEPLRPQGERKAVPDFTLTQLGGGAWSLRENRGKVLLLNFWATWCGPCRRETPELVNLHHRYSRHGMEVIGITLDERQADVPPFV